MPHRNLWLWALLAIFVVNAEMENGDQTTEGIIIATLSTEDLVVPVTFENTSSEVLASEVVTDTTVPVVVDEANAAVEIPKGTTGDFSAAKLRLATPAPEILKCYTCHSIDGPNKCNSVGARSLEPCDLEACYYIFGVLAINNVTKVPSLTMAGCGHAPVAEFDFQGMKVFTRKTHHNDAKCIPFEYSTKEDPSEYQNFTASFVGHSCNCRFDSCNTENRMLALSSGASSKVITVLAPFVWLLSFPR